MVIGLDTEGQKWDLFIILYNSIGFRSRGGKKSVGYNQYTALQVICVLEEHLQEWGVYPNPSISLSDKSNS